jgi:hypothetical protein
VAHWKKQLLQGAANIFASAGKGLPPPDDAKQTQLYEQIGRLQVELAVALLAGEGVSGYKTSKTTWLALLVTK